MFNVDDILAELAAGKSIEQLAQNAADVLNAAKAQYDKEQAAKKEAAFQKKKKMDSATAIMNSIFNYMDEFHPGFFTDQELAEFKRTFDAEGLVDAIDETVKMIKEMPIPAKAFANTRDSKKMNVKLSSDEAKELESALDKFLKENNLF